MFIHIFEQLAQIFIIALFLRKYKFFYTDVFLNCQKIFYILMVTQCFTQCFSQLKQILFIKICYILNRIIFSPHKHFLKRISSNGIEKIKKNYFNISEISHFFIFMASVFSIIKI